jgi:hypothetical protein
MADVVDLIETLDFCSKQEIERVLLRILALYPCLLMSDQRRMDY